MLHSGKSGARPRSVAGLTGFLVSGVFIASVVGWPHPLAGGLAFSPLHFAGAGKIGGPAVCEAKFSLDAFRQGGDGKVANGNRGKQARWRKGCLLVK